LLHLEPTVLTQSMVFPPYARPAPPQQRGSIA
jgi:hypothetical protein